MPPYHPIRGLPILAGAILAIATQSAAVWGQNNDEPLDDDNPRPANAVANLRLRAENYVNQVDQWVYGRLGGAVGAHGKLDSSLLLRIQDLDGICALTEEQKSKLRLAGRGDIKRFFDKVDAFKRAIQETPTAQGNVWQEIQPLQAELNHGIFGDGSIYQKTICRTLSPQQRARYEIASRQRKAARFRVTTEWFVAHLDRGLGLTELQRERLLNLLESKARPPKWFGQGDYWYFMDQTAKLPESELKSIFDAPQWRLLSRQFAQAKAMARQLKAAGMILEDDGEGAKAAGPRDVIRAIPARQGFTGT